MSRPKGKAGSSGNNNRDRDISSAIVRPLRKAGNSVHPANAKQLPEQDGDDSLTLNLEEELAKLELETLDDFVYNALGSFHINTDEHSTIASQKSSNNKYTVQSPTELLAEGEVSGNETEVAGTSSDKRSKPSYRDSGISSGTADYPNSPNVFVIEHSLVSLGSGSEGQEGDGSNRISEMEKGSKNTRQKPIKGGASVDKKTPTPQQPNGSVGGSSTATVVPAASKQTNRPKIQHEHSLYGHPVDSSILRADLLAAVEQNKSDKVRRILSSGIDPNSICDDKGRWPLHIAALLGHASIAKLLLEHGAQRDQPDTALERSPLLYAAANSPETVKVLLAHRVDIHARNKFGSTALHYSAGAGQAECCRLLAAAGCDVHARDRQKMTPLHMAARVDDIWAIDVLLEYGADIHAKDGMGKNALHHAAETGEGMESDYAKMGASFKKLIASGCAVNAIDNDGKTALYYAIQTGSAEAVMILHELGAELMDGVSLLNMARKFPNIIPPFLDRCVSSNIETCDAESKQFYIQFDYTCLTVFPKDIPNDKLLSMQNREETESILREMGVLHGLTRCKDSSILSHPVCESLLRLKWKKVKWYLYLDMLLFAVFLAFLTAVIFMEYESDNPRSPLDPIEGENGTLIESSGSAEEGDHIGGHNSHERYCMDSTRNIVVWSILWVLTALLGIREMIQLIQAPLHYVVQVENMLELVLVSSVALLSLAECGVKSFVGGRDHFAAVCLIVGWTIQVTLYGKIPIFGVYIRMFAAVAVNILKCMFTYLGLLFAFSLTLHFLFRTQKDFDSVGFTFLKTFAMMIGEIDLARTFIDNGRNAVIVPFTSHLVVALFIIFISIILSSLFLALAVCDISSMQREGEYMQLVQQVKVASQLEDALQKRSLLYPQFGMRDMRSLHQRKGVIFPNLKDHGKLSKDALEIVMTQHTRKRGSAHNEIAPPVDHTSSMMKATNDVAEDLIVKLKSKMDKYASEMDKRSNQMFVDMKGSQDRGSTHLNREVLLIKSQLEDMNICLREMSNTVKMLADRTLEDCSSPTSILSEVRRPVRRSQSSGKFEEILDNPVSSPEVEPTITPTPNLPASDTAPKPGPSKGAPKPEEPPTSRGKTPEPKTQKQDK